MNYNINATLSASYNKCTNYLSNVINYDRDLPEHIYFLVGLK